MRTAFTDNIGVSDESVNSKGHYIIRMICMHFNTGNRIIFNAVVQYIEQIFFNNAVTLGIF